jgi:hypothetical protein
MLNKGLETIESGEGRIGYGDDCGVYELMVVAAALFFYFFGAASIQINFKLLLY